MKSSAFVFVGPVFCFLASVFFSGFSKSVVAVCGGLSYLPALLVLEAGIKR